MSTTVDSRVLEMRFDNSHFENNVSTTMSTLDKLKQKLHLDGATKGLEDVSSAAKKVDMTGLGTAVDTVQAKFSAMQVIGVTALANITNSAVNAGKRMISALTIDPVKTGFQEYETQINAVQTILANTSAKGTTIDDVNVALEELNKYADMTIYNFTEMTRNIGTFTAAGIDLDTSVNAIQGIANLAAVSGSTSQQASTAMYQLSQALASGTVKLMDWNSVVNAGMGGEVFQNALKKTSAELGTGAEKAIEASGSFRESLKSGWLTAEVLTETLKKFTSSGANEYVAEYTGLSTNAVEAAIKEGEAAAKAAKARGEEADAIEIAAEALAKKSGKNKKEIQDTLQLAKTSTDAATKVKTFTQLWDVLKESAQSGWSQTWKIIVGDFEEAKELLTPLSDFLTGFINNMSDARNRVLEIALNFTKPWTAMMDKLTGLKKVIKPVEDVIGTLEYFQDVVDRVWMGEFNNWGDNPDRRDLLKQAGYDPRVVQELVNLGEASWQSGKVYKLSIEEVEAAHKKFGLTMTSTKEETEAATVAFEELTDQKLKDAGLTDEEISLYHALAEEAAKSGMSIEELADKMSKTDGRTLLVDSFKNLGDIVVGSAKAIKAAWVDIFNPPSLEVLGVRLYGIIDRFKTFTESLRLTNAETGELNETGLKVQRIFKGIFAAIDIVLTVVGGPFKIIFKAVTQLLGVFGVSVLDVTAIVGDMLVGLRDFIDGALDFTAIFTKMVSPIKSAISMFKEWIASLKQSEDLPRDIAVGIATGFGMAVDAVKNFFKKIGGYFKKLPELFSGMFDGSMELPEWMRYFEIAGEVIGHLGAMIRDKVTAFLSRSEFAGISADSIAGLVQGFKSGATKVLTTAVEMAANLVQKVKDFLGIESPSKVFIAIGGFIIAGLVAGLQNGVPESLGAVKDVIQPILDWLKTIDFGAILAGIVGIGTVTAANKVGGALESFAAPFASLGDVFEGAGKVMDKAARPIAKVIKSTAKVVKGFGKVLNATAFNMRMDGIKTLTESLLMLIGAIIVLTFFDPLDLLAAVGMVSALALVLVGLAWATNKLGSASASIDKNGLNIQGLSSGLMGIGAAILLLAVAVKILGKMNPDQAKQGFLALGGLVVAIGLVLLAFGKLVKGKSAQNIDKFGKMMTKMAFALLLMVGVIKLSSLLNGGDMLKALGVFGMFLGLLAIVGLISMYTSKNVEKMGNMMLKMSVSLLLMVAVIKLAAGLKPNELEKGIVFLTIFVVFVTGLAYVSKIGGSAMDGLGKMLLGISFSMLLLVAVMKLVGMLTPGEMIKGGIAIAGFAIMIALLVKSVMKNGRKAPKVAAMILAFSIAIGILAAVAIICGMISLPGLAKGIAAVSVLAAMMGVMIRASRGAKSVTGNIVAITVAIGLMVAAVALLTFIDPVKLAITTGVMVALTGMLALVIKVAGSANKAMGALIALSGVIMIIGGVLYLLADLPAEDVIGSAIALGGLMLVMAGILALMIPIGKQAKNAALGALALSALILPLTGFGLVLAMMSALKVTDAIPNAIALSILMGVLTGVMTVLALLGAKVSAAMPAVGAMAVLGLVVAELAAVLGIMAYFNVQPSIETAAALSVLLLGISGVLTILTLIGPTATLAYPAMGAIAVLIVGMAVVLGALGALMTYIPNAEQFLDNGIVVMEKIGTAIGSFVGGLVGGFAAGAMSTLPVIATALSTFMTNLTPFIEGAKTIDEQVLIGVGVLTAAILAFTVAELISGVASMAGLGLVALGAELSAFIVAATPFIEGAKTITPESVAGVKALAETILILTAANVIEGLTSLFGGGASLENFAKQLPVLGQGLAAFSESIGSFTDEQLATVNCAAQAVKTLASAAAEIPNTGGLLASIVGDNDLGVFAAQFPVLGSGLANFLANVGTFTDEQVATVNCAAQAIKTLAQASSEIPNSGGWLGQIVGENDLGTFAAQFPILGSGLAEFLTNVGTFSDDQVATVDCAAQAIKTLAQASSEIPNSGGWLGQIVGENDLGTFAEQFPKLGTGIADFLTNVGTFSDDQVATVGCAAEAIKTLASAASEIPNSGGFWAKIVGDNDLGDFASKFPSIGEGIKGFVTNLGTFTSDQVSTVRSGIAAIKAISDLANADLEGAKKNISGFGDKLPAFAEKLSSFCSGMPSSELVSSAVTNIDKLLGAVENIAKANSGALATFATNLKKVGEDAVEKFTGAFTSNAAKTDLKDAAKKLAEKAVDGVETQENDMESAGKDLGAGLVIGIKAKWTAAYNAGYTLGQKAVQGEKDGQASNSPSKLTTLAGKWLGEGLIIGMGQMGNKVYAAGSTLGSTATKTISSTISRISDMVNTDIDSQPTIRPVLDLTDVKSGASALNNMLNSGSVGVSANVSAISSMMNQRNQNGVNEELVSAVNKLRNDLGKVGNTTYTINGVNYSENSDFADAMKTIVRVARMERRV